jgi:hypothetical protein
VSRYFDEVREGDELPPLTKQIDTVQVVKWSGATWTFVPLFYDAELARRRGLPGSLIPGPMKLALFHLLIGRWAGPSAQLRSIRVSYRRPDTHDQPITAHGVVTRVAVESGHGLVDLELWIENFRGERTVSGAATIELPARPAG